MTYVARIAVFEAAEFAARASGRAPVVTSDLRVLRTPSEVLTAARAAAKKAAKAPAKGFGLDAGFESFADKPEDETSNLLVPNLERFLGWLRGAEIEHQYALIRKADIARIVRLQVFAGMANIAAKRTQRVDQLPALRIHILTTKTVAEYVLTIGELVVAVIVARAQAVQLILIC